MGRAGGGRSSGGGGGRSSGGRMGGGAHRGGSFGGRRGSFGGARPSGSGWTGGGFWGRPFFRPRIVPPVVPVPIPVPTNTPQPQGAPPPAQPQGAPPVKQRGCTPAVVIALAVVVLIVAMIGALFGDDSDITPSTVERQPLPSGSVVETAYYTDELGWIKNQTVLQSGLKKFYKETGVQPYLYLTDTVDGTHTPTADQLDAFANNLYDELFTDEAHILLVFFEYNRQYKTWYVCGAQAKTVIDAEAADILLDCIDYYYYNSNVTDEEYFSNAFEEAGERIMKVPTSPWITVLVVLAVLVVVVVLFLWWYYAKEKKLREAELTATILNTPLEAFGDQEAEQRAAKYETSGDNGSGTGPVQ